MAIVIGAKPMVRAAFCLVAPSTGINSKPMLKLDGGLYPSMVVRKLNSSFPIISSTNPRTDFAIHGRQIILK